MAKNHSSTVFMEKRIVIAFNAMKSQVQELKDIITEVRMQESLIQGLNSIKFLGVLDQVLHPSKFVCLLPSRYYGIRNTVSLVHFSDLSIPHFIYCVLKYWNSVSAVGFHFLVGPKSFIGSHARAIEEDVSRKVDACLGILQHSAEDFESIEVTYACQFLKLCTLRWHALEYWALYHAIA